MGFEGLFWRPVLLEMLSLVSATFSLSKLSPLFSFLFLSEGLDT